MEDIFNNYSPLNAINVSRETFADFETFISMVMDKNKDINIISKKTAKKDIIRNRHIIDSAQAIEFVDFNEDTTCDIGSGGGMPGIVIAIILKNLKKKMKLNLYEKSHHKSTFLKSVSRKLELDTEVIQEDIFKSSKIKSGTILARAFKPLPVVLDLVHQNFSSYNNLVMFMGKNGKQVMNEASKKWDFEYKEKRSITSKDSFLLSIKNIKKK
jgi:16S rRNA (guanine527-N7)-methyltransferase